jgi:hypothetical protein
MQITELEAMLFFLCGFLGWRLYIKNGALIVTTAQLDRVTSLVARICDNMSKVRRNPDGVIVESPIRRPE